MTKTQNFFAYLTVGLLIFLLIVGISALTAWVVMLVWNYVAAHFGWPQLNFWVTWGILFLLGIVKAGLGRSK